MGTAHGPAGDSLGWASGLSKPVVSGDGNRLEAGLSATGPDATTVLSRLDADAPITIIDFNGDVRIRGMALADPANHRTGQFSSRTGKVG